MMRKLIVFLAAAMCVIVPISAQALGFGNIKLHSALNDPLDAEIELVSPTEDDIANLKVSLASSDAFQRAGIERHSLLNQLRFAVKQHDNGTYYIHITTPVPVREPFLNFLLEMDWQNGRMLREYTMLLDPPGLIKKQPAVVEAPPVSEPAVTATEEAAAPAETPFVPAPAAAAPPAPEVEAAAPAPAPEAEPAATSEAAVLEDGEKFPRVPLTKNTEPEPVVPEAPPAPEAEAVPAAEPVAEEQLAPEPEPATVAASEPVPPPAPVEEEPMEAKLPPPAVVEMPEEEISQTAVFEDDSELFPRIPLTVYREDETGAAEFGELGKLDYGIVRKGDSLWKIAEKLRPDESVSIYQVMMALLKSNPDAFVDGNVNRLKVGHVLRIEDAGMLTSISKSEAAREYQIQTAAWEDYRQQAAAVPATQPIIGSEVETGESTEVVSGGELTLDSPDGSELQSGAGTSETAVSNDIVTLQDELRQVRRDANTMRGRNKELNQKLRELENELAQLQRSVSVKDDELAALQQQLAKLNKEGAAPAPLESAPETQKAAPEPAPVAETPAVVAEPEPAPVAETTPEKAPAPAPAEAARPTGEKSPIELANEIAAAEKGGEPAETPPAPGGDGGVLGAVMGVFKSVGDTLTGIFGSMAGNSLLIFIALPVLLVLIVVMLILVRRRKKAGEAYQESILTGGPSSVTTTGTEAESEEESSFLSDFAVSGAGAIQTEDSEVDPLTEADVFMAYGRYEAAEERLKEAIDSEPSRAELRLKLLELYHTTKNKPAFENTAEDYYASLGENANENPNWQKVVAMGMELVPGNPLFSSGSAAAAVEAGEAAVPSSDDSSVSLSDSQVMDIGLDTGVFEAADFGGAPADAAAGGSNDSGVLEYNLDVDQEAETAPTQSQEAVDESGLDFNLDLGESEPEVSQEESPDLDFNIDMNKAAAEAEEGSGLDFNLDLGESEQAEPDLGAGLDFELDTGTAEDAQTASEAQTASSEEDSSMIDLGEGFDLESPAESQSSLTMDIETEGSEVAAPEANLDFELDATDAGDLDIAGGDEVGTKLDLAKAYIDMGDPDGARSILDEVMDEGNSDQKQEAQELLQQIA